MKKFKIILLTVAMVSAMTTSTFAASCPTGVPKADNTGSCRQQVQNVSVFRNFPNVKDINFNDLCKSLNMKSLTSNISKYNIICNNHNIKFRFDFSKFKRPVTEKPVTEKPVTEKPVTEKPVTEKPVTEKPVTEKPVTEKPVTEKPVTEKPDVNLTDSQFAAEVVRLVNVERAKAGLAELKSDSKIAAAAYVRSTEQQQKFSHTRPNGTSCFTALKEQGISYRGAGENIAMGQRTPAEVMNAWMNSPGHRANILNKNFTKIGVNYYKSNGTAYWTQLFTY